MPLSIPSPVQQAAAAIVALINSSPRSPRQDEIEAVIAQAVPSVGTALASPLLPKIREAVTRLDQAFAELGPLRPGPQFDAVGARIERVQDELEDLEDQIPSPPQTFADLLAWAEIARAGAGTEKDGTISEVQERDVFLRPAGRLVEAVLQLGGCTVAPLVDAQARLGRIADLVKRSEEADAKANASRLDGDQEAADRIDAELCRHSEALWSVPPRSLADLQERAVIARYWHQMTDEPWSKPADCDDFGDRAIAELIEAVLQMGGCASGAAAMSPAHAEHYREWRALITTHLLQFGAVDGSGMTSAEVQAEEQRMADHLETIGDLADKILSEPARTWGDVMLYAEVCLWAHWPGMDPEGADAGSQLKSGPMCVGPRSDETLGKLLAAIFSVAGVGQIGRVH